MPTADPDGVTENGEPAADRPGVVTVDRRGIHLHASDSDDVVARAVDAAAAAQRVDRTRVDMLRAYAETPRCRRQHLLAYFGDHLDTPCGNCDRCHDDQPVPEGDPAVPVQTRVDHREWGPGTVLDGDDDRITVLFDEHGYRTLSMEAVREHDLLTVHRPDGG